MRKTLPVLAEETDTLKQRLQHEHHCRKKPRLRMLYRLASGQAHTSQDVAQLLGIHRNTVGHGLAIYEAEAWRCCWRCTGRLGSPSPCPRMHWSAWSRPCGSRPALPPMGVNDYTLYTIFRTHFNAKLKGPQPSQMRQNWRQLRLDQSRARRL
jgi:hypothetical protein